MLSLVGGPSLALGRGTVLSNGGTILSRGAILSTLLAFMVICLAITSESSPLSHRLLWFWSIAITIEISSNGEGCHP